MIVKAKFADLIKDQLKEIWDDRVARSMQMSANAQDLVGRKIIRLYRHNDNVILFLLKGDECESLSIVAHGDCCSESWFNHASNIDALKNATVFSVEETNAEDIEPATRQDYDQVWFLTIKTDKGTCTIETRNSSNGYYGGWITWQRACKSMLHTMETVYEDW